MGSRRECGGRAQSLARQARFREHLQRPLGAGNLNDGNQGSYWESTSNAFPQWAQVDLGASTSIDQVVLKLPAGWGARTQTLTVQGSPDGSSFTTIVASAVYTFNPAAPTRSPSTSRQRPRASCASTSRPTPAGRPRSSSELEIYGAGTAPPPTSPRAARRTESGHADVYGSGTLVDGNQGTYWESVNNSFPEWVQVDLGSRRQRSTGSC